MNESQSIPAGSSVQAVKTTAEAPNAPIKAHNGAETLSPFKSDLKRYPRRPWFKDQSIWAVAVYRFGRWNDSRRKGPTRWVFGKIYWVAYRVVQTLTGITMDKMVEIGPGLRIHHFGGIIIHSGVKIGKNFTLRQGVTIGNRHNRGPVPVIGDNVEFGACALALGGIHIGDGAKIGAMSLVLCDVPAGATAVGVPARIIEAKKQ